MERSVDKFTYWLSGQKETTRRRKLGAKSNPHLPELFFRHRFDTTTATKLLHSTCCSTPHMLFNSNKRLDTHVMKRTASVIVRAQFYVHSFCSLPQRQVALVQTGWST